jgi:FtsP/CotA-like multicopper oxidase with cupredoxin domain
MWLFRFLMVPPMFLSNVLSAQSLPEMPAHQRKVDITTNNPAEAHEPAVRQPFVQRSGGRVIYHLYVTDTTVNYTGRKAAGIAINGSIPAPALYFTEGDTAEIHVHNLMHMETSIHWHGLILPNSQDGVPYLTTPPIKKHSNFVYTFPIVQHGTYWYHSHAMLQEQSGMYGAFIIHEKAKPITQKEAVVLLSDWTNERPAEVERSLHHATDWYGIRKGATQDYYQAVKEKKLKTKLDNEWKRMMAMDVSDVYYDLVTVNGKPEDQLRNVNVGEKVRLRIINGSSSTYFWLRYAGGKITVVATDGKEVEPVEVDRLIIGVSETYDVLVTIPEARRYQFMATAEDRTQSTSLWIGEGEKFNIAALPRLRYFEGMKMMNDMMRMDGTMDDMGMKMSLQQMDMNAVMYPELAENAPTQTLNYAMLRSIVPTTLPNGAVREFRFELTGNMNRYVWTVNNKTISESDKILIKKGENIRIIIHNNSMMRHPMHLHGHFFRVLNGQGDHAPLKTVLDVMPMETDTIEFHASEDRGDWYFHCHILYHMMAGMGRIFSYNEPPSPDENEGFKQDLRKVYRDDKRFFPAAQIGLESNGSDGEIRVANTRWLLQTEWRLGLSANKGYESETHIGRHIGRNQWLLPYLGFDWRYRRQPEAEKNLFGQVNTKDARSVFCIGVQYTLPFLVVADARVDSQGRLRAGLAREDVPLTARLRFNFFVNTDKEYMTGMKYIISKYFSLSAHYDSDMGPGAGVTIQY